METGLRLSRIYEDSDIVEFALSACNGVFAGAVDLYLGQGDLGRFAETLRGFPESVSDERVLELGCLDSTCAGGGARLCFKLLDKAGHAGLDAALRSESSSSKSEQHVYLFANIEPAAIDSFIAELIALDAATQNEATLRFDGAITRA